MVLGLVDFNHLPSLLRLDFESSIHLMNIDGTEMIESCVSYFLNSKGLVFDIPFSFNIY